MATLITPLPTPPSRNDDQDTFTTRANAFLGALPTLQTEINAAADTIEGYKDDAEQAVTDAEAQVDIAQEWASNPEDSTVTGGGGEFSAKHYSIKSSDFATTASGHADDAEDARDAAYSAANFVGDWSSQTGALAVPASVSHDGGVWLLLNNLADVTASEPGQTGDWALLTLVTKGVTAVTVGGTLSNDPLQYIDGGLACTLPGGYIGQEIEFFGNWADTVDPTDDAVTIDAASGDSIDAVQTGGSVRDTDIILNSRGSYRLRKVTADLWVLS